MYINDWPNGNIGFILFQPSEDLHGYLPLVEDWYSKVCKQVHYC